MHAKMLYHALDVSSLSQRVGELFFIIEMANTFKNKGNNANKFEIRRQLSPSHFRLKVVNSFT